MATADFKICRCELRDEAGVYEVCLKTGEAGNDATHLHDDPRALGHIYVGPYMKLEPDLAFVLEDHIGVCGYVLGALDSAKFYQAYLNEWLPPIRAQHPEPTGNPTSWTATQKIYYEYHHPDIFYPKSISEFPSHMHIDLLPRAQGQGWGAKMVQTLLDELKRKSSPGVHLAMNAANHRAYAFYRKLGFDELTRASDTIYLGKRLN
jgi:ribosomal protein S18 acetylase RimI-like enzyme